VEPLEAQDRTGYSKIVQVVWESDPEQIAGVVLVHPETSEILASWNTDLLGQTKLPAYADTVNFSSEVKKGDQIMARVHLWLKTKPIQEAIDQSKRAIMEISGGFVALAILISVFMADRLVRPIKRLVQGVEEIGKGNFDVVVPVTTRNEVGQLTEAFNETAKSLKEKEYLKSAFKSYVSQEVMEASLKAEGHVQLGGERRLVTILFSDIRDFTTISEKMKPEEVVAMLNEYFSEMTAIVAKHGGFVDKFMGDAIMAVYGIPKPQANHAEQAVHTSVEMLQRLQVLHGQWEKSGKPIIKMGIGLNTGEVVAGNIGSQERMSYTIIGDPANVASRVQALNKTYHTTLLITDRTHDAVAGKVPFQLEPVEKVQIRGRAEPVQIYTIKV
jgi:adenylate cyclase